MQPRAVVARRPNGSIVESGGSGLPRDSNETRTQFDPKQSGIGAKPVAPVAQDDASAKLLVIASMMSLVVVVLSLAVLSRTTGVVNIQTDEPVRIQTVLPKETPAAASATKGGTEAKAVAADLMLTLDVEPKDASLVVRPTEQGFQVKVAASGYQPETRTIEKGVEGKIAVKLEPAPKKAIRKKTAAKKRSKKKGAVKTRPKPDAEVFLTGSDL